MKIIYFLESVLDKIFRQKYPKILFCFIICSVLIISSIIIFCQLSFLENFFGLFIILLACFIFFSILFLLFKKLNNKFNINNKLRYVFNNLYLKTKKNFYTKSEMILFYIGISLCSGFYIIIIKNIYFVQHILFWVLYLLFIVFYRLVLHIIYKKS